MSEAGYEGLFYEYVHGALFAADNPSAGNRLSSGDAGRARDNSRRGTGSCALGAELDLANFPDASFGRERICPGLVEEILLKLPADAALDLVVVLFGSRVRQVKWEILRYA
jgi:hypothetical protein